MTNANIYGCLQQAYDHFNRRLFGGYLPACLITLHRHRGAYGYFSRRRYIRGLAVETTDEIALNPDLFAKGKRSGRDVAATLAHAMVHLWQAHFGHPGRGRYHNQEWAQKMREIGLTPTDSGAPGGKSTGDRMAHLIVAAGPFEQAYLELVDSGLRLEWAYLSVQRSRGNAGNRQKFTCPRCGLNAWARPAARLICGECRAEMKASFEHKFNY